MTAGGSFLVCFSSYFDRCGSTRCLSSLAGDKIYEFDHVYNVIFLSFVIVIATMVAP